MHEKDTYYFVRNFRHFLAVRKQKYFEEDVSFAFEKEIICYANKI